MPLALKCRAKLRWSLPGPEGEVMYEKLHSNRNNLLIHLIAVPSFIAGAMLIVYGLFTLNWLSPFVGGALALLSIAAQGRGHKMEEHPAEPFNGPGDFMRRILREQFITFPRFVLSGQWRRQFRAAGR